MTEETKRRLRTQLASEIEFKIRLLEKRAAIHAQTIYPIKDLELKSPDYGLGVIPKLIAINNNNEESEQVIAECNRNKKKLLFINKHINVCEPKLIVKCLFDSNYARMTIEEIECFLQINNLKKKEKEHIAYLYQRISKPKKAAQKIEQPSLKVC